MMYTTTSPPLSEQQTTKRPVALLGLPLSALRQSAPLLFGPLEFLAAFFSREAPNVPRAAPRKICQGRQLRSHWQPAVVTRWRVPIG